MRILRALTKGLLGTLLAVPLVPLPSFAGQATLAWNANTETNIAGYKIWCSSKTGSSCITVGNTTSTTVSNLLDGATYTIYATAYNTDGLESAPSTPITYTMPASSSTQAVAPAITSAPGNQVVVAGTPVSLTVTATGSPLQYQWLKNSSAIAAATNATYQISSAQAADSGAYSVTVSNSAGSVTSASCTLSVLLPPTISQQPASQTPSLGGSATFSVTASGSAPLAYQWFRNGTAIQGATSSTFLISSVQSSDVASYNVRISNSAGQATSASATLSNPGSLTPPSITQQPASQTLASGSALSLSVSAAGSTPLSYQWTMNGMPIQNATNAAFQISSFQSANAGSYSVTVTNAAGAVTSSAAAVSLATAPTITQQPASQNLVAGSPLKLAVAATGTAPLQYFWTKNGTLIAGATNSSFQISSFQSTDVGAYAVLVSNPAGGLASSYAMVNLATAPVITQPPANQSLALGSTLKLSVTATGSAPLLYQWTKDGASIAGATNSSFQISSVQTTDAGSYVVTVSNAAGSAASPAALVNLAAVPTITQQPANQTLAPGAALNLSVTATSSTAIQYQWTFNGASISGATNSSLQISSVQAANAGSYAVTVANSAGSVTSSVATVTVLAAPAIAQQPASQTLAPGSALALSVTATGTAPLQYQWSFNGVAIANAISSSLQISSVQTVNAGSYTVTISNSAGSVTSTPALVSVVSTPVITQQPASQTIASGTPLGVSVTATSLAPLQYQWFRSGVILQNATNASFQIASAQTTDSGSYQVQVSNAAGSVTSSAATITVLNPPTITQQPGSQTVLAGSTFNASVTATGSGPLQYQWYKNGAAINGATASTFQIPTPQSTDAASYTVTVSNLLRRVTSSVATLTVLVPPAIAQQPASQALAPGAALTLSVAATGSATLQYQWFLNGSAIPNATNPSYQVASVQAADAGAYSVTISNSAGSVTSSTATVSVLSVPVITSQPASQTLAAGSALNLSVQATGSAPLLYQWQSNGSAIPGATNSAFQIASIQNSDAASYTVTVSNSAGSTTSAAAIVSIATVPVITQQPVSQALIVGSSLNLSVGATGAAPLQYQWLKNGSALANATNASFQIASFQSTDAGGYQVKVSNSAGSAVSATATISIVAPPTFVAYPASQTVALGSPVVLSVQVSGSAPFQFQWFHNNVLMSGVNSDTLQIPAAQAADAGTYTVRVSNAAGSSTSYPGTLTVLTPPAIATQPASQTAPLGSAASFSASATGSSLHYQWFKDGVALANANSSLLQITAVQNSDAGNYSLEVSNIVGVANSAPATLTTVGAPAITSQPVSQTLVQGAAFVVSVQVTGSAPLQFQWYLNGAPIPNATSSSYQVTAVGASDAGSYTVQISNSVGAVTSTPAALAVVIPPAITSQPASQTLAIGSALNLSVQVSGSTPLTYQWFRNGTALSGANAASFQIAAVQSSDAGSYTVTASNAAGSVTSGSAFLTVLGPPSVVTQPVSQTLPVGSALSLSIQASGSNPLTYQWFKNGAPVANATSATYQIASVQTSDSGSYTITVSNGAGSATSSAATVTVLNPPAIVTQPAGQTLAAGASFSLSVQASGSNPLQYQWSKNGTAISGATASTYQIAAIQSSDAGSYTVQVSNAAGSVTSSSAFLTVLGAPSITSQPQSQTLAVGGSIALSVQASGSNPLNYQWFKNGAPIANAASASYQIASAQTSDAGSYTVTVSNGAGSATSSPAIVTVLSAPSITAQPASQTLTVGSPLALSVQVTGSAPFQYQWSKNGTPIIGATAATYQIASVQPSDAASYAVAIANNAGSAVSSPASITVIVPPSIVTQPSSQSVLVGSPLALSVQASGTSPLTYQWSRNGVAIGGAVGSTLTISSAQIADAGSYTVQVSNPGGTVASAAATVTVSAPPVITSQPQSQVVIAGSTLTLSVQASGSNPIQYRWMFNGATIANATSATLQIPNMQSANAGSYTVAASNAAGSATSSAAAITVQAPPANTTAPAITTQPASQNLASGAALNLSVAFTGTAPIQIQWYLNGAAIPNATSASYQAPSVQAADAGSYTVTLSNAAGSVTSNPAQVAILVPPTIVTQPVGQNFDNGTQITLSVVATGTGPLQYQWYRDGVKLTGATSPNFSFTARSSNQGAYHVTVSNSSGSVTSADAILTLNSTKNGSGATKTTKTASAMAVGFDGRVSIARGSGATIVLRSIGTPGHVYTFEAAGELPASSWSPLASVIASDDGLIEFSSASNSAIKASFFRVIDEQP